MHDPPEQDTIPSKLRVTELGSSAETIKLQRLLYTISQNSPVSFFSRQAFDFEGDCQLSALPHEACAPELARIHTGGNSIAFS